MLVEPGTIFWASIIASALVSALVTLLVELLAKPHLEVRKERIMSSWRNRWAASAVLRELSFVTGRALVHRATDMSEGSRDAGIAQHLLQQRLAELNELVRTVTRSTTRLPDPEGDYLARFVPAVESATMMLQPFGDGRAVPSTVWNLLDLGSDPLDDLANLIDAPPWRLFYRLRRRRALDRAIRKLDRARVGR